MAIGKLNDSATVTVVSLCNERGSNTHNEMIYSEPLLIMQLPHGGLVDSIDANERIITSQNG